MKFSYNWLNKYFNGKLPAPEKLANKIGLHSFELEGVEEIKNKTGQVDWLIDWDILPNRSSDCLCYDGIVKEISTILNLPALDVLYETQNIQFDKTIKTSDFIKLKIEEPLKVLRATKRIAINVKVTSSPYWLVEHLESMGQKSINNVVDITNYVMLVTGQPVHAFDYDKLVGEEPKNIFIKHAQDNEKIIDLSGEEHTLNSEILIIADDEKSLDIAGIKGGEVSGVDENTTRVLMSAVNFEYENIRNTSKKLKLQTDASKRYENEIPLHKVEIAQKLFGYLLQELAGATISAEIIDSNPNVPARKKIDINLAEINSLLGLKLEAEEVENIFKKLKFKTEIENQNFTVLPTLERLDLNIKEDLIEEIGRIYGYENIPETFPNEGFAVPQKNKLNILKKKIGETLISLGFFEVYNRTLVKNGIVELANSLNANATCLRNKLLDNLKIKVEKNFKYTDEPKMFEIGKIFTDIKNGQVLENYSFAGMIGKKKIKLKQKKEFFYETKGVLEKIFEVISVPQIVWKDAVDNYFIADIFIKNEIIGSVGLTFWEINLEKLANNINTKVNYKKVSKFPKIERDVAFWVPLNFQVLEAEKIIKNNLPIETIELKLFDIYQNKENQKKSFAFRITFQSLEKTLSDEFANEVMEKIYKKLEKNNFEIR